MNIYKLLEILRDTWWKHNDALRQQATLWKRLRNHKGTNSNREKVCQSGLWNSNHVDAGYDNAFLSEMDRLVSEM